MITLNQLKAIVSYCPETAYAAYCVRAKQVHKEFYSEELGIRHVLSKQHPLCLTSN